MFTIKNFFPLNKLLSTTKKHLTVQHKCSWINGSKVSVLLKSRHALKSNYVYAAI